MATEVPRLPQSGTDWSSAEVAAVVADYFRVFADEVAGRPYNKDVVTASVLRHSRLVSLNEQTFDRTVAAVR